MFLIELEFHPNALWYSIYGYLAIRSLGCVSICFCVVLEV